MIIPHLSYGIRMDSIAAEAPEEIVQHRVAHQYHLFVQRLWGETRSLNHGMFIGNCSANGNPMFHPGFPQKIP